MKNLIIITIFLLNLTFVRAQVSTPFNFGTSSDYLGWDANTFFDLNIENRGTGNIYLSTHEFYNFGMGIGNNGGVYLGIPASNSLFNNYLFVRPHLVFGDHTGIFARNISVNNENMNYGGYFITRANGIQFAEGVRGEVNTIGLINFGIYAVACNYDGKAAAVHGVAASPYSFAAWFEGDVLYYGGWSYSDENLKTNIQSLENCRELLNQLEPKAYNYNQEESQLSLPDGIHYGLIAQNVETIVPHAVKESAAPPKIDEEDNIIQEAVELKSVNYHQFLPIILGSIQERQVLINEQASIIQQLSERIDNLELLMQE